MSSTPTPTSSASGSTASATNAAENSTASARRARKREQDRRCQRMLRERTKNRIAYLEGLLAEFEREGSSAALQMLRKERDEAVEDRDRLLQALRTINRVVKTSVPSLAALPDIDGTTGRSATSQAQAPPKDDSGADTRRDEEEDDDDDDNDDNDDNQDDQGHDTLALSRTGESSQTQVIEEFVGAPITATVSNMIDNAWPAMTLSTMSNFNNVVFPADPALDQGAKPLFPAIPQTNACKCCVHQPQSPSQPPPNPWFLANEILSEPIPWSDEISQLEDALAEDIPVRAVAEGWEAAARSVGGILPPSWQQLRQVDETLFINCGATERLAVLRTMYNMLVAIVDTTPERRARVPEWYIARPSQTLPHGVATDYVSWPGVRDRFVFYPHRYCTNKFWSKFATSFRIVWPFEFRDCYTRNMHTGRYNISPTFHARISDIRSFTMREEMFQIFPELRSDIPAFDSIVMSLAPPLPSWQAYPRQTEGAGGPVARRKARRKQQGTGLQGRHHAEAAAMTTTSAPYGGGGNSFPVVGRVEMLGNVEEVRDDVCTVHENVVLPSGYGIGGSLPTWSAWSLEGGNAM